jgi:hypothetical protein
LGPVTGIEGVNTIGDVAEVGSTPEATTSDVGDLIQPGTRVDVRDRFLGSWVRGFEVAEAGEDGYRVLRLSDHSLLPGQFSSNDVRRERRRRDFWWR